MARWWLAGLLALAGCRTVHVTPASTLAALAAKPGAHLRGAPVALAEPVVLNREDFVFDAKLSPDGTRAAISRLGARGFHVATFELPSRRLGDALVNAVEFDVEGLEFSPDGARVAAASRDGSLRVLGVRGDVLASWQGGEPLVSVAWSRDGRQLAVGGARGLVTVLSSALEWTAELRAHADEVRGLAFRRDGSLVTASWDRTVQVLRFSDEAPPREPVLVGLQRFEFPAPINDLSLSADGDRAGVAFSETKAERTPEVYQREKRGEPEPARDWDCAARVDLASGDVLERVHGHRGVVSTAAISPDGQTLVTGGWDRRLVVHAQRELVDTRFGWSLRRVRFSRDGRRLIAAAWTPLNGLGDHQSDPAAVVYEVVYDASAAVTPE